MVCFYPSRCSHQTARTSLNQFEDILDGSHNFTRLFEGEDLASRLTSQLGQG